MRLCVATLLFTGCIFGSNSPVEGEEPGECIDGIDNDDNGFTDCEDAGCVQTDVCILERDTDGGDEGTDVDDDTPISPPDPLNDNPHPADPDCDGAGGQAVAGATGWFAGIIDLRSSNVTGYEAWALLPNQRFSEVAGATDCQMAWTLSGSAQGNVDCTDCSFTLSLDATFDDAESDCLSDLQDSFDEGFDLSFAVDVSSSGNATLELGNTNEQYASGQVENGVLTYRTDSRCFFF